MNGSLFTVAVAMCCASAVAAESQTQIPKGIAACAGIADVVLRASCYDSEVAKLRSKEAAPSASSPPAAAPPPDRKDFGAESLPSAPRATVDAPVLEARITALRELQTGDYLLTLDNGQVWRQPERRLGFEVKTGDAIRIKKGTMGAYRLWLDSRGPKQWVRVVRVQ